MMNIIQRNLPAKIIALVAAVALWFFVMTEQNPMIESSYTVPLTVVNAPAGYKITKDVDEIKIKVRGQRSLFATALATDFKVYVDLQGIEEGKQQVKVQSVLPQGFEFIETSPESVTFVVDKIIQKQMKTEILVAGSPAAGMTVDKITPSVQTVMIEGPREAVNAVARVVGTIAFSANDADFKVSVPLQAVNEEGKEVGDVHVLPQVVDTNVSLIHGQVKKMVAVKAAVGSDLPAGYILNGVKTDPAKIEVSGEEKLLDSVNSVETELISLADVNGPVKREVKIKLQPGIAVTNKSINVTIDVAEKK
ncbi:MAG: CdaR family protein [Selenomonadaceae bacterium]